MRHCSCRESGRRLAQRLLTCGHGLRTAPGNILCRAMGGSCGGGPETVSERMSKEAVLLNRAVVFRYFENGKTCGSLGSYTIGQEQQACTGRDLAKSIHSLPPAPDCCLPSAGTLGKRLTQLWSQGNTVIPQLMDPGAVISPRRRRFRLSRC